MAKIDLNGISVEEINRNSNSSYAASISSGEIFRVVCRHSKNGNVLLAIEGKALTCKDFNNNSFVADGCILYNPPLTKTIVAACDDSNDSIYIIKGVVTKTAPAPSSDTVLSKEDLMKEKENIQATFFKLAEDEQKAAKSRMETIEKLLKA
ncbi:MAG: hypothetical protein IT238_07535 [Bacteroidia bacterium]|nr:hypothetical protein [Bacteroidia bacterium]